MQIKSNLCVHLLSYSILHYILYKEGLLFLYTCFQPSPHIMAIVGDTSTRLLSTQCTCKWPKSLTLGLRFISLYFPILHLHTNSSYTSEFWINMNIFYEITVRDVIKHNQPTYLLVYFYSRSGILIRICFGQFVWQLY